MLLVASNLNRRPTGFFNTIYSLEESTSFENWVVGCAAAGRLAQSYAQRFGSIRTVRNMATKISETLNRIRVINMKIMKHVMRSTRSDRIKFVCSLDDDALFAELDAKWRNKFVVFNSQAMQMLGNYLRMFDTLEFKPSCIRDLLLNQIDGQHMCLRLNSKEAAFFGMRSIGETRGTMSRIFKTL